MLIATFGETFVDLNPALFDFSSGFIFKVTVEDAVAVVVIDDEEVLITARRAMREASCEVVVCSVFWSKRFNGSTCCKCFNVR